MRPNALTKAVNRLLPVLAAVSILATLAPAPAEAAARRSVVKKPRVSKTFIAAKRRSVVIASKPSYGQLAGLHGKQDELSLRSSVALVIDQDTNEVLFSKNEQAVLPIASLTKMMTGLIVSEAKLPMDEVITITQDDVDTEKGSSSRLRVGTKLS